LINKNNKERIVKMKYIIGKNFEKRINAKAFEMAEAGAFMFSKQIQLNVIKN
jgi:hypothetical protein